MDGYILPWRNLFADTIKQFDMVWQHFTTAEQKPSGAPKPASCHYYAWLKAANAFRTWQQHNMQFNDTKCNAFLPWFALSLIMY